MGPFPKFSIDSLEVLSIGGGWAAVLSTFSAHHHPFFATHHVFIIAHGTGRWTGAGTEGVNGARCFEVLIIISMISVVRTSFDLLATPSRPLVSR